MNFEITGAGDDVVLLIRPLGGTIAMWGRFCDVLAERARVVAFDARGTGANPGPPRRSTRDLARDALTVLDAAGIAAAHVFGESLGGMVATRLAIDAPARVRRLALASTVPRGSMIGAVSTVLGIGRGFELMRCFARGRHAAARCLIHRLLSAEFRAAQPDEARRIEDQIADEGLSRRVMLALLLAAGRHDATSELGNIAAPTLVLYGGHDPLLTADSQRALTPIPDVRFEEIAHSGHAITLEQPVAAAERVAAHLLG